MDAQEFGQLIAELPDDALMAFVQRMEPQLFADMRSMDLADAKNYVTVRVLQGGNAVSTLTTAQVGGDILGHSVGDTLNFVNGTVTINDSNRRQFDIIAGGGGADCMFDVLVSSCFSTLPGWTEGQVFISLSGCTFKTTATVQKAYDYIRDNFSKQGTVFICAGSYSGGIHVHHDLDVDTYGAGADVTTVYGNANSGTDGYVVYGGTDNGTGPLGYAETRFRDICFDGTQGTAITTAVYGNQNGIRTHLTNVKIKIPASLQGGLFDGNEVLTDIEFIGPTSGTQAANGWESGNAAAFHSATNIKISGCSSGAYFNNASGWTISNIYITGANGARGGGSTAGALTFGSNNGLSNSKITGAYIVDSVVGMNFVNSSGKSVIVSDFVISNCTYGIDIRGSASGISDWVFDGGIFVLGTSGQQGVLFDAASNGHCTYCQFTNLNFRGYASGNEIVDASGTHIGTGTCGYHNISDAGTVADFGTVQGHTAGGSGTSAPSGASFVTMAAETNLSAERVLTAGTGITVTDGGANSTVTLAVDTTKLYAQRHYVWAPDAAPGAVIVAGNQQGNVYHTGPNGFTALELYVDCKSAPGASGLPITVEYGDTDDLDTVASWTTIATLTLSSEKSSNTTSMTTSSVPASKLMRMDVGTIVGSPKDATITLRVKEVIGT